MNGAFTTQIQPRSGAVPLDMNGTGDAAKMIEWYARPSKTALYGRPRFGLRRPVEAQSWNRVTAIEAPPQNEALEPLQQLLRVAERLVRLLSARV